MIQVNKHPIWSESGVLKFEIYLSIYLSLSLYVYNCIYIYIYRHRYYSFFFGRSPVRFNSLFFARLDLWRCPGYPAPGETSPTSTSGTASIQVVGGARSFFRVLGRAIAKKSVWYFFLNAFLFLCFFPSRSFWYILDIFPHVMFFPHVFPYVFPIFFLKKFTSFMLKFRLSRLRQEAVEAATGEQVGAQLSARDTALQLQQGRDTW